MGLFYSKMIRTKISCKRFVLSDCAPNPLIVLEVLVGALLWGFGLWIAVCEVVAAGFPKKLLKKNQSISSTNTKDTALCHNKYMN